MSKYRVTNGIHVVNGTLLRAGETIEVKGDGFLTPERAPFFQKIEEPAKAPKNPKTDDPPKDKKSKKAKKMAKKKKCRLMPISMLLLCSLFSKKKPKRIKKWFLNLLVMTSRNSTMAR